MTEPSPYFKPILDAMLPSNTFNNKLVYITGGGTGLGKQMALTLSNLGADVIIISRKISVLEKTSKEIESITGRQVFLKIISIMFFVIICLFKVSYYAADIRNVEEISKSVDYCVARYSKLPDIIINNAAGNFISPTERLSLNAFKTIIDIVLIGTFNVTSIIGKRLIAEKKEATFLSILASYIFYGSGYVSAFVCISYTFMSSVNHEKANIG